MDQTPGPVPEDQALIQLCTRYSSLQQLTASQQDQKAFFTSKVSFKQEQSVTQLRQANKLNLPTSAHFLFQQALYRDFPLLPLADASISLENHFSIPSTALSHSLVLAVLFKCQHMEFTSYIFKDLPRHCWVLSDRWCLVVPTTVFLLFVLISRTTWKNWGGTQSISIPCTALFPEELTSHYWRKQLSPISYQLAHHQPSKGSGLHRRCHFTNSSQQTNPFCTQTEKAWVSAQHITLISRSLVKTCGIKKSLSINIFTLKNLGKSQKLQPVGWIPSMSQAVPYGYPVSGSWPLSKSFTSHAHSYFKHLF